MGLRNALNRVRKYDSNLDPNVIEKRYARFGESMLREISAYFVQIVEVEIKTKATLCQYDCPVSTFPSYLSHARELYRLSNKYAGLPLLREIRLKEAKWQGRGLNLEILKRIRVDVFGIPLPEEL
ncbi:MAG: hypothetical protein ABIK81_03615 [candidate division WOR-3 bacterium]